MNWRLDTRFSGHGCARRRHLRVFLARWIVFGAVLLQVADVAKAAPGGSFTFVVLGDNRGGASGEISPAFRQVVQAVQQAAPRFVLNTGDMIYGHTNLAAARQQWQSYMDAVGALRVPVHHVPGNHDLWDSKSASLYREFCGPAHWSFNHGSALFIGLDTESHQGRLGPQQFAWLKRQLAGAGRQKVFVMLHRPLFPADGAVGSSLDAYPSERDELHRLFVQYRRIIKAVFLGHEHFYHFEERDGVGYYITGGGGANLYEAPELGGFHHFLVVHVAQNKVSVELRRVGAQLSPLRAPEKITAGTLLESWEHGLLWYPWDSTVTAEITSEHATEGRRALRLNLDLAQCSWPVLSLPLHWVPDWQLAKTLTIDVFLPGTPANQITVTPTLEGTRKLAAPAVQLKPGWNAVQMALDDSWLPKGERAGVRSVEWGLTASTPDGRMALVFDNLRAQSHGAPLRSSNDLIESWEHPLLWRVLDESVTATPDRQFAAHGQRGLKLSFDFSKSRQPVALARLNPPWDLKKPAALALDVYLAEAVTGEVSASIGLRRSEVSHVSPAVRLKRGWNKVRAELGGSWLPQHVRAAAEQVECRLFCSGSEGTGWVVLDNLRAEK